MITAVHAFSAGSVRHREAIVHRGGSWRQLEIPARIGVIEHTAGPILFDLGYHPSLRQRLRGLSRLYHRLVPWRCRPDQTAAAALARLGYAPDDLQFILVSHFHADHIAGLVDFPRARVVASTTAWRALQERSSVSLARHGYFRELLPADLAGRLQLVDPPDPGPTLEESALDLLGDETLGVVSLPGHAPGQVGLWARPRTGREVLFVADATFSRAGVDTGTLPSAPFVRLAYDDADAARGTLDTVRRWHGEHPSMHLVSAHAWEGPPDGRLA